jgi:hypothetical protein
MEKNGKLPLEGLMVKVSLPLREIRKIMELDI